MQQTKKLQEPIFETVMPVKKYFGRNSSGSHSALGPNESREIINWDIYHGEANDYLKSRRGSAYIKKASGPTKRGSTSVTNAVTWDIGAEEYLITQEGTSFYSQALLTPGNPTLIALAVGGAFTVTTTAQADMFLSGDKLYIFHVGGNYVLRWSGSVFLAFPMGLVAPKIYAVTTSLSGAITGSYTMGIEKVYRASTGGDIMASTPNRKTAATPSVLAVTGTISAKKITLTLLATELDNDSLWTHLRVWRSKNKNRDVTDPGNPIEAQGNDDELYEEALITKAEMAVVGPAAIATSATLPQGNYATLAGKAVISTDYTIILNSPDSVLSSLIELDRIELVPIPAAAIGCFHINRIFFSGVVDAALDDLSKNNIWYSEFINTPYSCQYNPLNFIDTNRDGQNMMRLMSLEKDLIGIKEAKTGRLPLGDVNLPFETMDYRIGINNRNLAAFVPGVGIVAVTNDFGDFRIFGYDLRWTNQLNGIEISLPVRAETSVFTAANVSFGYINGKLMISDGTGLVYALHAKEGRGWTKYSFPMNSIAQRLFVFAQNSRAAIVSKSTHVVEIEVSGSDADVSTADDITTNLINLSETTYAFQSDEGRDILEGEYLSCEAVLGKLLTAAPYVNGLPWSNTSSEVLTNFTPDPAVQVITGLKDREYKLFLEPKTIGSFQWMPHIGNYLHYVLRTTAPATMKSKALHAVIDKEGMGFGGFDPFQQFANKNTDPNFVAQDLLLLTFEVNEANAKDYSGFTRDHTYSNGSGGAWTRVGNGSKYQNNVGDALAAASWNGMDYMVTDQKIRVWKMLIKGVASGGSIFAPSWISQGGDGNSGWRLYINSTKGLTFENGTTDPSYKFTTADNLITDSTIGYVIVFVLSADGLTGTFYIGNAAATSFGGAVTTTRSSLSFSSIPTVHALAVPVSAATFGVIYFNYQESYGGFSANDAEVYWNSQR